MSFGDKNFTYGPRIVKDGLVFYVDAANPKSYVSGDTTTNDLISNITGTLENGTGFSGENNGSWSFDGADDYIELGQIDSSNPISLYGTTEQTWETWVNSNGIGDAYQRIMDKSNTSGGGAGYFFGLGSVAGNDKIYCQIDGIGISDIDVDFTHNIWQHLVITRINNTINGWNVYINGILKSQEDSSNITVPSTTTGCKIGSWNHSTAREFNGQIAVVKLYNKALTAAEVLQNYNTLKGRFGL